MADGELSKLLGSALKQLVSVYMLWVLLALLAVYMLSGIYKIERDSVGVLLRFGAVADPLVEPGLHYKLPWPIDEIRVLAVKQVKTMTIDDFGPNYQASDAGEAYRFFQATNLPPYCITGDNNIVSVTMIVKFTISDPVKYLYRMKASEHFMRRSAAVVIVRHLAQTKVEEVLTFGKKQLEFDVRSALIKELDRFESGIAVSFLEIKEINPPGDVQDAFDRVVQAKVQHRKTVNQAQGYYNRIVPQARTEADKFIQQASAQKKEKILRAEGEAARFISRLEGYRKDVAVNKIKIYLDFIEELYPKIKEVRVVDGAGQDRAGPVQWSPLIQ
jgi:membrane protease subunit HflK